MKLLTWTRIIAGFASKRALLLPVLSAIVAPFSVQASTFACKVIFLKDPVQFTSTGHERSWSASRVDSERTRIELELSRARLLLSAEDQLVKEINDLSQTDSQVAAMARAARAEKQKGRSLLIDVSDFPSHMRFFLEGAFARVVDKRGLSKPFVSLAKRSDNELVIHHLGDRFPMLVRWSESVPTPQRAQSLRVDDTLFQVLELPLTMKSKESLYQLPQKFIYSLISGSAVNKFISSHESAVMRIASLLHDAKLFFMRPTQKESQDVTHLLNTNVQLRRAVRSLLLVAPTASGKTRVIGDRIVDKIRSAVEELKTNLPSRKLTVLMTKTPDLTSELSKAIGEQLSQELGQNKFRLVQWGGEFSQEFQLPELLRFIDQSKVPVVLVTSYPTLATRARSFEQKSDLMSRANALIIDEAHNATGTTFQDVMRAANAQAQLDRNSANPLRSLDIFGVTASPVTRTQRTIELFDHAFWAGVDTPNKWAKEIIKKGNPLKPAESVLEWIRVIKQYNVARDRGEISASDPIFFRPEERGFDFSSIFQRGTSGTQSSVSIKRLLQVWPEFSKLIEGHGPGVIHTYPRDADAVATSLSELTGKNYVSLRPLTQNQRLAAYQAFRDQTLYEGRHVDAIVGSIREGLDFPKAGWYVSLKKFVRFPENIQGPGRVVRLSLNKPAPVIVFFGAEANRLAFQGVRELVMTKLGRLPVKLNEPRLYSGARRISDSQTMAAAIEAVNVSIEALLRIRGDIAKDLGDKAAMNPDGIRRLQDLLLEIRLSGDNQEISQAMKSLVVELNSFPFFTGQLKSTWEYCDRILAQARRPDGAKPIESLTPADLEVSRDPARLEQIRQFRALFATIGVVPRSILMSMDLKPVNVTETALAVNAFVARNGDLPFVINQSSESLKTFLELAIQVSPDGLWRALDTHSRGKLKTTISESNQVSLEQALNSFFATYRRLPKMSTELIGDSESTVADRLGAKLRAELIRSIHDGTLDVSTLNKDVVSALDRDKLLESIATDLASALIAVKSASTDPDPYVANARTDGLLTYENLMHISGFRALKTLHQIADLASPIETPNANAYRDILKGLANETAP